VRHPHSHFQRAKGTLDRLATLAHGLRILVEALLYGLQQDGAFKLMITHTIERTESNLIEAVSAGYRGVSQISLSKGAGGAD